MIFDRYFRSLWFESEILYIRLGVRWFWKHCTCREKEGKWHMSALTSGYLLRESRRIEAGKLIGLLGTFIFLVPLLVGHPTIKLYILSFWLIAITPLAVYPILVQRYRRLRYHRIMGHFTERRNTSSSGV